MRTSAMRSRAVFAALVVAAGLGACQPIDDVDTGSRAPDAGSAEATPQLGAPVRGAPASIAALLERTDSAALQWQDQPRVAEVRVGIAGRDRWAAAAVTYLAADADRLFTVTVDSAGATSVERTTLATLEVEPVPEPGLADVPLFPDDAQAPTELAAAARPVLSACGFRERIDTVVYTSGAPFTWNGEAWSQPPAWRALVLTEGGAGVALDPVTAEPLTTDCTTPEPAQGATVPPEGD